jgi:hypothetical protein
MTGSIRTRILWALVLAAAQAYRDAAFNWNLWGPWPWWR